MYLNYPRPDGRRVAITHPLNLAWVATLEEESAYANPTKSQKQTLAFHGHSRAGNVTGHLVYANYGSRDDFQKLKDMGVEIEGSIVLVRYHGAQREAAFKVKAAEQHGALGCLIYSDPKVDGFVRGHSWPNGRWRPKDSVERDSVSLKSVILGDPLTPGYASTVDAQRISKDNNPGLVNIPSLPLSWRDAEVLLKALGGHGQRVPKGWVAGTLESADCWTGGRTAPVVHLRNELDESDKEPIYNVMGSIPGIESPGQKVIVGNHRDAWCFGAGDPGR